MKYFLAIAACVCVFTAVQSRADAQYNIGAGINVAAPMSDTANAYKTGWGLDGWIGYALDMPLLHLLPEFRMTYTSLAGESSAVDNASIWRAVVGGKVAIGEIIRVYGTAHFGYGNGNSDGASTYDLGGGLEFTALPIINIGAGVSYNSLNTDTAVQWLNVGAWASLQF